MDVTAAVASCQNLIAPTGNQAQARACLVTYACRAAGENYLQWPVISEQTTKNHGVTPSLVKAVRVNGPCLVCDRV
jgi:hypothetical protein